MIVESIEFIDTQGALLYTEYTREIMEIEYTELISNGNMCWIRGKESVVMRE